MKNIQTLAVGDRYVHPSPALTEPVEVLREPWFEGGVVIVIGKTRSARRVELVYLPEREVEVLPPVAKARVVIDLTIGNGDHPRLQEALSNLADIMAVQAEDGLYTLGHEDADSFEEEGPGDAPGRIVTNVYVGPIESVDVKVEVL